jgi:peptide/nickel transport system substrate-binding protein
MRLYDWSNPPSGSIHEEATVSTVVPFMPIFNNLVLFDQHERLATADTIRPELAESWAWDPTRTILTLKLRQGVSWHDGKPFTAKDVVCTMDLLQGKGADKLRKNPRKIWWQNLKTATAIGDHEVSFTLGRPQPAFLTLLASGYSPMYPCHVSAADMRTKPIGTGPFKLVELKSNEIIRVERNPNYWKKGHPYLDAIETRVIANRSTRVLAFVTGDLDMTQIVDLTPAIIRDISSQDPTASCAMAPTNGSVNLIINRERPPFNDAKLRDALTLTLDRKAFNTILNEGGAKIGGAMMAGPEGSFGMTDDVVAKLPGYGDMVEGNRAKARKIMESLGYTKDKPMALKVSTRNQPLYVDPAVLLVDQLKSINIEAELDVVDTSIWFAKVARGDYTVGLNTTGAGADDPDVVLYENYACGSERNYTKYCNKDVDKLIDAQSQEADHAKRKRIVWDIEQLLAKDGARPIIIQGSAGLCRKPYLKGFALHQNNIFSNWRFDDAWLDK